MSFNLTQRQAGMKSDKCKRQYYYTSPSHEIVNGEKKTSLLVKCPKKTESNNDFFLITPRFQKIVLKKEMF